MAGPKGPRAKPKARSSGRRKRTAPAQATRAAKAIGPTKTRIERRALRVEDLLALTFEFHNLEPARKGVLRRVPGLQARVIVHFPGQHIAEAAITDSTATTGPAPPVASRPSGPSRLAFALPDGMDELRLTLDALLDWDRFEAILPPSPSPQAEIKPPLPEETAIEAPWRLFLSPGPQGRWRHASQAIVEQLGQGKDGSERGELWHSRLGAAGDGAAPEVVAVWSPDYPETGDGVETEFTTSLSPRDRRDLVTVTQEATDFRKPLEARTLILSPLGAWLDLEGAWQDPAPLERLAYRAALAQDQKVVVVRSGYLYPTGHKASVVKITERRVLPAAPSGSAPAAQGAYLVQRSHVAVREPEKGYGPAMGLKALRILETVTPPLDDPTGADKGTPFWIEAGGGKYRFRVLGTDWAGNGSDSSDAAAEAEARFAMPSIFLDAGADPGAARTLYDAATPDDREHALDAAPAAVADPRALYNGQGEKNDAWGEPLAQGRSDADTRVELLRIAFEAVAAEPEAPGDAPFETRTRSFQARLPSLAQFLDDDVNKGWFRLRALADEKNLGEVFAEADDSHGEPPIPLRFEQQSDRSGGVAAPSYDVKGVSRIFGPVANTAPLTSEPYQLADYFPAAAKLLGNFRLKDVIGQPPGEKQSPAIPKITLWIGTKKDKPKKKDDPKRNGKNGDKKQQSYLAAELKLGWSLPFLQDFPRKIDKDGKPDHGAAVLVTTQGGSGNVPNPKKDSTLGIQVAVKTNRRKKKEGEDKPPPNTVFEAGGSLNNFSIQLLANGNGVRVGFKKLGMTVDSTKKVTVQRDLGKIHFVGAVLAFVQAMQSLLGQVPEPQKADPKIKRAKVDKPGPGDVAITVGPITAPKIELGALSLDKLTLKVSLGIFFTPKPVQMGFYLSAPDKPFEVTVGTMGGGGFLAVEFNTERLTGFDISLEFGVIKTIDFKLAKGKARITGGARFTYASDGKQEVLTLTAFVRLYGQAVVAGFIEIKLEVVVALIAETDGNYNVLLGQATVTVGVKIAFFSLSASFSYTTQIAGSQKSDKQLAGLRADRPGALGLGKTTAMLGRADWLAYQEAFAA